MGKRRVTDLILAIIVSYISKLSCFDNVITYLGSDEIHQASYTKYSSWNSESTGIISFSFITSNSNGLLLHVGDSNSTAWNRNYLELRIKNGMLNFISRIKNGTTLVKWKRVWYTKEVDDLKWHDVQIRRNGINAMLSLDGERLLVQFGAANMYAIKIKGSLYFGGLPGNGQHDCQLSFRSNQFIGAIKDVGYGPLFEFQSGYERILVKERAVWGYVDHCLKNRGRMRLCQNGGICVNKFNNFSCNCLGTGYEGRNCENESNSIGFRGLDYVEWKPLPSEKSLEANEIALRFRTRELNGVLMYIGNATKYLVIELFAGKLVIGSQLDSEKLTIIASNRTLNNDDWHLVEVSRREMHVKVSLNGTNNTQSSIPGSSLKRHLQDSKIFVGGKSYVNWLPGTLSKQYFMGCLQQVFYNGGNVIKAIIKTYRTTSRRRTKHGNIVSGCPSRTTKAPFTRGPRSKRYRPTVSRLTRAKARIENKEEEAPNTRTELKRISGTSQTMLIIGIIIGIIVLVVVISATVHYFKNRYRREMALSAVYTRSPIENGTSSGTMPMYISPSSSGEKSEKLKGIVT
ncbi:neurexin-1-like isoform X2 [Rhopilema esculentum]|eukprot:gene7523-13304_t